MLQAILRARHWMAALAVIVVSGLPLAAEAGNVRLIMVERDDCRYCIEWNREIAPKYPASAEGRFAPLQRAQRGDDVLKHFNPVIYTPTFLVISNGEEVGRVTGYAGKLFFWEELDEQLAKAGFTPNWGIPELDKTQTVPRGTDFPLQTLASRSSIHAAN